MMDAQDPGNRRTGTAAHTNAETQQAQGPDPSDGLYGVVLRPMAKATAAAAALNSVVNRENATIDVGEPTEVEKEMLREEKATREENVDAPARSVHLR